MKDPQKPPPAAVAVAQSRTLPKLLVFLILFVAVTYLAYILKLAFSDGPCPDEPFSTNSQQQKFTASPPPPPSPLFVRNRTVPNFQRKPNGETEIGDIVFGIAASAKLWEQRKEYIKLWFNPEEMRAVVWVDEPVRTEPDESLPPVMVSGDTAGFPYRNRQGRRSAIRISRIVSETVRLGVENVRWVVMGDDDTVFVRENLVRVLRKYDHRQFYYIGSSSESHLQNIHLSYGMAYGGGGFAISYALAEAVEKMQDRCLQRYPGLYGSDDRMQACMAELGVPLTKELGFHQVCFMLTFFFFFF